MDFFLSKPIRRPALKHVLKTYCQTIPEEAETTPPNSVTDVSSTNGTTTKVVNLANASPFAAAPRTSDRLAQPESHSPSPLTSPGV